MDKPDPYERFKANKPVSGCFVSNCVLPLLKAKRTVERRLQAINRLKNVRNKSTPEDEVGQDGEDYYDDDYVNADPMMQMMYGTGEDGEGNALEQQVLQQYEHDADYDLSPPAPEVDDLPEDEEEALARRVEDVLQAQDNPYQHSYELICKQFIENFHRGAETYARESQLARRVSEWTDRLEPILHAQEEAKPFDIHECSDEVLSKLSVETKQVQRVSKDKKASLVAFEDIADGGEASVCRMFLACLQLANLGNVEIVANTGKQAVTCNEFKLRLLSDTRRNDIENFRAPSLADT
ncbi:hypothetical protein EON65_32085 [archaeon]|nr:MAG: hypothetical protein EON65_32085 [archaeon]